MTQMEGNQVQRECAADHPKYVAEYEMPRTKTKAVAAAKK